MRNLKPFFIGLNLMLLLGYFLWATHTKENILEKGRTVYLRLAPVDPRSLMQGDYMSLRYQISDSILRKSNYSDQSLIPKRGYVLLNVDHQGVATYDSLVKHPAPLDRDQALVNYTRPNSWNYNIGAESYFFQEGKASVFDSSYYGVLKIDDQGHSVLVGLADQHLKLLMP